MSTKARRGRGALLVILSAEEKKGGKLENTPYKPPIFVSVAKSYA